jgi:hypothetical protein
VTHAVAAVFSTATTVVLMLLVLVGCAVVLAGSFLLTRPVLRLVFAGLAAAARRVGRVPLLAVRAGIRGNQQVAVRMPGPRRWHRWVAAHPGAPESARSRLVRHPKVTLDVLEELFTNVHTSEAVRIAVVRRCEQFGGVAYALPDVVHEFVPAVFAWPLTYAEDPVLVRRALRHCLSTRDRRSLRSAYARLASLAGPEAVWAVELEHAGTLARMDPVIRRSMQAGNADELLEWLQ